ncbi:MAG: nucleotidyltransferase family protein [Gemmatimonadaceae bacterium]
MRGAGVGGDVGTLLAGSWRHEPAPPDVPAAALPQLLTRTRERLLSTACGSLVWWRLRGTETGALAAAAPFRDAHRHHALRAAVDAHRLSLLLRVVRAAGVEPLLLKGWSTSRRYPAPGLRPPGDIDLCVRPGEREVVERAIAEGTRNYPELAGAAVDLHTAATDLADRPMDELLERSLLAPLGDASSTQVRVLGAEDHLRLLALHLLRHGAWRPIWLCDVALMLESEGSALDWDRCLRGAAEPARRVACALGLAHRLLGARLPAELPAAAARCAHRLPSWLVDATLRQWGSSYERYTGPALADAVRGGPWEGRATVWRAIRHRWPNPIEASVALGAPFNRLPRLPIQVGEVLGRAVGGVAGLGR